jgi:hypothetical protein
MLARLSAVVMLMLVLGCPSEYGKHGRIDQALEDDLKPHSPSCPAGQRWGKIERNCQGEHCPEGCIEDPLDGGH